MANVYDENYILRKNCNKPYNEILRNNIASYLFALFQNKHFHLIVSEDFRMIVSDEVKLLFLGANLTRLTDILDFLRLYKN